MDKKLGDSFTEFLVNAVIILIYALYYFKLDSLKQDLDINYFFIFNYSFTLNLFFMFFMLFNLYVLIKYKDDTNLLILVLSILVVSLSLIYPLNIFYFFEIALMIYQCFNFMEDTYLIYIFCKKY